MAEIVTPNEIAAKLRVSGLRFRNWLRDQKAAGHPLVASHHHGARYQFSRAEADQLATEFAEQVLGVTASSGARQRTSLRSRGAGKPNPLAKRHRRGARQRSNGPGHRVTLKWMGKDVETLADLLRPGLRAVAIGINPAPKSVAAGHYYQGNYGQTFFRRLRKAGVLPDGEGFEDDRCFGADIGFTDVVKRPTPGKKDLEPGELEHGKTLLEAKLIRLDVPLLIFVFKTAADTLLGPLPPHFYGLVPRRRVGPARIFVMPGPTAAMANESDAIRKLKRALRASSS